MIQWRACKDGLGGDIINGNHNQLIAHGLDVATEDKSKMCPNSFSSKHILTAILDKTFDLFQTIEFCHYLGGQVAVAVTKAKAETMIGILSEKQKYCGSEIFAGFLNSDKNTMFPFSFAFSISFVFPFYFE